jgi:hypothetical protein
VTHDQIPIERRSRLSGSLPQVSYDLVLVRRRFGRTLRSALARADRDRAAGPSLGPDAAAWDRIVERSTELFGPVAASSTVQSAELVLEATLMQLNLCRHRGGISLPYGDVGATAINHLIAMYQLGRIVEDETGLTGYDPQRSMSLDHAAADPAAGLGAFETAAALLAGGGPSNVEE